MEVHVCSLCGCEFSDETDYIEHSRDCDGSFSVLPTSQQSKINKNTASASPKRKLPPKPFVCLSCGKEFVRFENLKTHRIKFHPEVAITTDELPVTNVPKWKCNDLNSNVTKLSSEQENNIVAQLLASSSLPQKRFANGYSDPTMFTCNVCYRQFTTKLGLNKHSRVHSDKKLYKCKICGNAFVFKVHLDFHIRSHEYKPKKANKASSAPKKANKASSAPSNGSLKCPKCDRKFDNKRSLRTHIGWHERLSNPIDDNPKHSIKLHRIDDKLISPKYVNERIEGTPDLYQSRIYKKKISSSYENGFLISDETLSVVQFLKTDPDANSIFDENRFPISDETSSFVKLLKTDPDVDSALDEYQLPISDDISPSNQFPKADSEAWFSNVVITDVRSLSKQSVLCHQCGKNFLSSEALLEHEKIHIKKSSRSKIKSKSKISPSKSIEKFEICHSKNDNMLEIAFVNCPVNENLESFELERTINEETIAR